MKAISTLSFLLIALHSLGQADDNLIQTGNDFYKQQQYDKAVAAYKEVLAKSPFNGTAKFNLATTLFRQGQKDDAVAAFQSVITDIKDAKLKAQAFYNIGVILGSRNKLEESVEAYKSSLRLDPSDKDCRENLQKALLELKKKSPPKKQDDKKKQPQKQQQQPQMNKKEVEQQMKLLEQKEKEVEQRMQKEKSKTSAGQAKDW